MSKFTYEILPLSNSGTDWDMVFERFHDSNIYQTAEFTTYSQGGESAEKFILKENNKLRCVAVVRLKLVPKLVRGVAYIRWGPLCKLSQNHDYYSDFNTSLRFLYEEYVVKRKLVLRIFSGVYAEEKESFCQLFQNNHFKPYGNNSKTIIIDLSKNIDELRASFRKKWRYTLKQAEKNNLNIVNGTSENYYKVFKKIYIEMHKRKNFTESVDVNVFETINSELSEKNKMQIFIAYFGSEPVAAVVVSAIGDRGIYLLGGSSEGGLKVNASYLIQFEVIKWLKSKDISIYDLGGIDEENNPGVYRFKSGMGGKEVSYLGGFQACEDKISKKILELGELIFSKN